MSWRWNIAVETVLDVLIFLLVIYPLGIVRLLAFVCPTLDSCGPIVGAILVPAAFTGFLFLFISFIPFFAIYLVLMLISTILKFKRYAGSNFSLSRFFYSVPFIALLVMASNFLL